jgi:DHA2 family methylenomycin A resistance protein-like MFS transporter
VGAYLTLAIPENADTKRSGHFDVLGQLLSIVALAALTTAVIEARQLGMTSPIVLGACVLFLITAPLFVLTEARSKSPMLPLRFFKAPGFSAAVIYGVVVNLTYYGIVFILSLYLQRVHGYSAVRTGLAYLPLTATFFGINIFSGWLVGHIGARRPMIFGALIDAAGFALFLTLSANSSYWLMLPAFALLPMGMGLGVPAMTNTVLSAVEKDSAGVASAVLNAARQAAGAMGVAIFGALAGDQKDGIVAGLHASAIIAIVLLLAAAAIAALGIHAHVQAKVAIFET